MTDLFALFSKLVTPSGTILIPGIMDTVAPLTEEERARYDVIDLTVKDIEAAVGAATLVSVDKGALLMNRMRYPSLSIHGINGAFSGLGAKTVIPSCVHGKFSIRLVPNQTPEAIDVLVQAYLTVSLIICLPFLLPTPTVLTMNANERTAGRVLEAEIEEYDEGGDA